MDELLFQVVSIVISFSVVIFVHEYGHYLVGKACGIGIEEFSIGIGPKMISFKSRSGTIWKVCALPLGGYVKFAGDDNISSVGQSKKSALFENTSNGCNFNSAAIWARTLTVLAGPLFNFIFSILLFTLLISLNGILSSKPVVGKVEYSPIGAGGLKTGDEVLSINGQLVSSFNDIFRLAALDDDDYTRVKISRDGEEKLLEIPYVFQPIVKSVEPLSPASRTKLLPGDVIMSVNNNSIKSFDELKQYVLESNGQVLTLAIWRDNLIISKMIKPESRPTYDSDGNLTESIRIGIIGGANFEAKKVRPSLFFSLYYGYLNTVAVIKSSLFGIVSILNGDVSSKHLSGPVGIAQAISDVSSQGIMSLLSLIAVISTGIGIVNLFPIPILDGGHILLLSYEKLIGKSPSERVMKIFSAIGIIFLLSIMLFATFNDVLRINLM